MKHRNGAVSFSDTLIGHPLPAAVKAKSQDAATPQLPPLPPVGCSQPAALPTWRRLLRRVLPQVVSVFIGACFIVIRPISSLSGDAQYGFLILVIYTLFFFAGENTFGRHLQITLIGILGAAVGVGWSALAVEIGCIANRRAGRVGSVGARIAPALFLATIAFAGGYGKSKFPRLSTGFMLSIFVSIWLISSGVAIDRITARPFLSMLYSAIFAAGVSLLSVSICKPKTTNRQLAEDLINSFGTASELLLASLHYFQRSTNSGAKHDQDLTDRITALRQTLTHHAAALRIAYDEAVLEIVFSYFPIQELEGVVTCALHARTLLIARTGIKADHREAQLHDRIPAELLALVNKLGMLNIAIMGKIRANVADSSNLAPVQQVPLQTESLGSSDAVKLGAVLEDQVGHLREALAEAMGEVFDRFGRIKHRGLFENHAFKSAFFITFLLELSQNLKVALLRSEVLVEHKKNPRRFYFPPLASIITPIRYAQRLGGQEIEDVLEDEEIDEEENRSRRYRDAASVILNPGSLPIAHFKPRQLRLSYLLSPRVWMKTLRKLPEGVVQAFQSPRMYRRRARLHRFIASIKTSRHLKHAFKCSLGITMLALPGYLPIGSPGYEWHQNSRLPWAGIAFLTCLQTTTAATVRDGILRTLGTVFGGIYAALGQHAANGSPYGLVAWITIQSPLIAYLVLEKPAYSGLGIVFQLTLPSILFFDYLRLSNPGTAMLALLRVQNIELGIVAALLLNIVLWPFHAKTQVVVTSAKATDKITKLYLSMSRQVLRKDARLSDETKQRYEKLEADTKLALSRAAALSQVVHLEPSLLPKPVEQYRQLIASLGEALDLFSCVRVIREQIPRRETVLDVLPERTELVSSVLITLHAIAHSLHTHGAVLQYLPDPREALNALVEAVEQHIDAEGADCPIGPDWGFSPMHQRAKSAGLASQSTLAGPPNDTDKVPFPRARFDSVRSMDSVSSFGQRKKLGLSFAYALAENEAISEFVAALERAVDICRQLYGVASFIDQQEVPGHMSMHVRRGDPGSPTRSEARVSMSGQMSPPLFPPPQHSIRTR